MTQTDSLRRSASFPSDQRELDEWLDEEIAALTRLIAKRFASIVESFINSLTADASGLEGAEDFLNNELAPELARVTRSASEIALATAGKVPGDPALWSALVDETAANQAVRSVQRLRTVQRDLWTSIQQGFASEVGGGHSVPEIKKWLQKQAGVVGDHAETIARTELMSAFTHGDRAGMESLAPDDQPVEHVWLATNDARTRPEHVEADGQTKPFNAPFIVGGESMMHPHAGGSARNVINCRCVELYLYPGDQRPDGTEAIKPWGPTPQPVVAVGRYDAMKPDSQWSDAKRQSILAQLGQDASGKLLADTLDKFQDGGSISRLRTNIGKRIKGVALDKTSEARVDGLLDAIRNAPTEWAPSTLYRGMTVSGKIDNVIAKYEPGADIDLSLTSFTSDRKVATRFQQMTAKGGTETRVMVELIGDKKVLPIQNLARDSRLFKEKEWVGAGQYRIVSVQKSVGAVLLRIEQVGVL